MFPLSSRPALRFTAFFFFARLMLLASLPPEALRGYGDAWNFQAQAALPGWPYLHYWTEFPPLFPYLSAALWRLAGGREYTHLYLLVLLFSAAQAGGLFFFARLAGDLHPPQQAGRLTWVYAFLLLALPYGWWYFDPLAVFFLLWGLWAVQTQRPRQAGLALGLGALTKFFPLLALPSAWFAMPRRRALQTGAYSAGIVLTVFLGLYLLSPRMTAASWRAQRARASWETVWALLDGNLGTGNLDAQADRARPETAALPAGKPARLPAWGTLPLFGALGLWGLHRARPRGRLPALAAAGFAWGVFLLWMPGYSPQWVLYLLPLTLLLLPPRRGILMSVVLLALNVLEWPVLLARGWFQGLYLLVPARTLLLFFLTILFYQAMRADTIEHSPHSATEEAP